MKSGKINVLIGNSWGSEGKGNVAAYLAERYSPDICISNNAMNAGHCFLDEAEEMHVLKILPVSGVVSKKSMIIIGSGAAFTIDRLFEEANKFDVWDRLIISPTAAIIDDKCIEYEKENLRYISSTMQGVGAAFAMKALRSPDIKLAKDVPSLSKYVRSGIPEILISEVEAGKTALAEIPQGIGLSLDGDFYPYCTSRQVNVGQAFAYMDVPLSLLGDVIGVSRSYPIRVGGVDNFSSGEVYPDSVELTWEEISKMTGKDVKELTTVTKRVRRVFSFSKIGFEMGVKRNGINICFISFADYLDEASKFHMDKYITNSKFKFDEMYFVNGFGHFDKNIEEVIL